MKTVINEHGCTTHPYGEPSLDVTVPFTVNGQNVTEQLAQLTVANLNLNLKVEELKTALEALTKTTQEALANLSSQVATKQQQPQEETVVAKNGKKPTAKPSTDSSSTETIATTAS